MKALVAEHQAGVKEHQAKLKEIQQSEEFKLAREAKDNDAMRKLTSGLKAPDLTQRFADAAKKYAGSADQAQFLVWIAHNSPQRNAVHAAVDELLASHIDHPQMLGFVEDGMRMVRHYQPAEAQAILDKVAADSKNALVRAQALYLHAMLLQRDRKASDEVKAKASELLAQAAELAAGTELADVIAAPEFEKNNLQIGMPAPDIEGEDLDGVRFKLSDYRGKVVVLDFWGDW
jgi:hypothetical protein